MTERPAWNRTGSATDLVFVALSTAVCLLLAPTEWRDTYRDHDEPVREYDAAA